MICTCYDAYFGKFFNAEFDDVINKTKQFNERVKDRGYVFSWEYFEYIEDLSGKEGFRPSDYLLNNFGFQTRDGEDLIVLENGTLNGDNVIVIRPWNR